jgi:hypothetical protein
MPLEQPQEEEGLDFSHFQVEQPTTPQIPMTPPSRIKRIPKRILILAIVLAVLTITQIIILYVNRPTPPAPKKTTTKINIHGVVKNVNLNTNAQK